MNKYQRRQKAINKARRLLRIFRARSPFHAEFFADGGEYEHRLLKTHVPCSCHFCGNPRRYFGKVTIKEKLCKQQE